MMGHRITGVTAAGFAATIMVSLTGSAIAQDNQTVWEGFVTNTHRTAACQGVGGTGPGDTRVSIFRPHINASDTNTFLSIIHLRAALTLKNTNESTVPQMRGSGNYTGYRINSKAKFNSYNSTYNFTVRPATIVAMTRRVTIDGTINDYFNHAGCNVKFKAVFVKRID
jgi:hypothetical protein